MIGPVVLLATFAFCRSRKKDAKYNFDPNGKPGGFEPFLNMYLRAAEFIIGLAAGSIVLLVGTCALHSPSGLLPWFYRSPLLALGYSVILGVSFIVWQINRYESYRRGEPHTALKYSISETLGYSALACFCIGYMYLAWVVAR